MISSSQELENLSAIAARSPAQQTFAKVCYIYQLVDRQKTDYFTKLGSTIIADEDIIIVEQAMDGLENMMNVFKTAHDLLILAFFLNKPVYIYTSLHVALISII